MLPFTDLSPQRDQEYFCDGIAEEIVNSLCCVRGLRVASRTSAAQFRGQRQDVREIGRALGVGTVLEGSVRKDGSRVRITAQLVDCSDGYHRWSESFDRELDDVFALQTEIARKLVAALRLTLTPQENALLGRRGTRNADAYDLYLRGQARMLEHTDTSMAEATALFRAAIEHDPDFAQAHAGLAHSIALRALWGLDLPPSALEEGSRASARALALQPNMPEAQVAIACLHSLQGRDADADAAFEAALRLNPASYDAHYFFARHCFGTGRYERAAALFEQAHRLRPDEFQPLCMLQGTLERLGRRAEERAVGERAMTVIEARLRLVPDDTRALQLGAVQAAKLGRTDEARALAARAREAGTGGFSTAYNLACTYAALGDREAALASLDEAVVHGRGNLGWIERDPDFDVLRDDPRFREIVGRLRGAGATPG